MRTRLSHRLFLALPLVLLGALGWQWAHRDRGPALVWHTTEPLGATGMRVRFLVPAGWEYDTTPAVTSGVPDPAETAARLAVNNALYVDFRPRERAQGWLARLPWLRSRLWGGPQPEPSAALCLRIWLRGTRYPALSPTPDDGNEEVYPPVRVGREPAFWEAARTVRSPDGQLCVQLLYFRNTTAGFNATHARIAGSISFQRPQPGRAQSQRERARS